MITDHPARAHPAEQYRYPPASTFTSTKRLTRHDNDACDDDASISYVVHTNSHGISDLRLQVSQEASSSKQPLRPVYFRERVLTEHNEIVDKILDATTGRICWTIHRPTRGWYLYLRSPALPEGTAISIRASDKDEDDPAASPLTFSVNTKVRTQALELVRPRITSTTNDKDQLDGNNAEASATALVDKATPGLARRIDCESAPDDVMQGVAVSATGREDRKPASGGHTRRRSGATGSGKHGLDSRHPTSAVTRSPMIPETEDEAGSTAQQSHHQPLSGLTIPTSKANSSTAASPQSSGADRPYSPTLPSTRSPSASYTSTFLLTDGRAPHQHSETRQSWTRWAYSLLPSEVRPSLSLDADKSFSLYWLNPPSANHQAAQLDSVEVVRFHDQSGRWMWNSHTRGRLTLQAKAMQAIGLQREFWITAALAYIQFLEDKDAYEAAREA